MDELALTCSTVAASCEDVSQRESSKLIGQHILTVELLQRSEDEAIFVWQLLTRLGCQS